MNRTKQAQPTVKARPLHVLIPAVVTKIGPDAFSVAPGKPLLWLTPLQLGQHFGLSRKTIYNWREDGIIPKKFIQNSGRRRFHISSAAVPYLETEFANRRR